jgi:hypothetical protein
MHSADGEPEHEPHTVTDDRPYGVTVYEAKLVT